MRKASMPVDVTEAELDALLEEVAKLEPVEAQAIRLRLKEMTYAEIAAQMNSDNAPDSARINQSWVGRKCGKTTKRLYRFMLREERLEKKEPAYIKSVLYKPAGELFLTLQNSQHSFTERSKPGEPIKKYRTYICRCGCLNWSCRIENRGFHSNPRIYTCADCGAEYDGASRKTRLRYSSSPPPPVTFLKKS